MHNENVLITLLHITTVPESLGFLTGQAGYMRARGIETIGLSSPGTLLTHFAQNEQVPVYAVQMPRRITPLRDLVTIFKVCRVIRRVNPNVVHGYTPKGGLLGMISARLMQVPVPIYHVLGLPFMTATGLKRQILRWTEQIACRLALQVFCVSHSVRDILITEGLCPADKVKVLANGSINGVDSSKRFNPARLEPAARQATRARYQIPDSAIVIGFLGRIVRDKGLIELTQAWQMLKSQWTDLHLLIVGQFEPHDPLPAAVEEIMRSDPAIHLTGYVDEIVDLYQAMDLLVLPTYREGFPVVPLEAAAMRLPVIATQIPGCSEAVADGVTGRLVPPYDALALAEATQTYLNDPELRVRHGQNGRERVIQNFRPELIWEATYQEYLRLLQSKGINPPRLTVHETQPLSANS